MTNITAVILAGGVGTRFLPFATDKTLFPFMGQSLLHRTITMLGRAGVTNIIVATNSANHAWLQSKLAGDFSHLKIQLKRQIQPKGMGDALLAVKDLLPDKDILVMNAGDMVDDRLVAGLIRNISDQYAIVTGMKTQTYQPLGYFELVGNSVIGIKEKPGPANMPSNLANLVFHYFSDPKKFIELVTEAQEKSLQDDIYEQALSELMKQHDVKVYHYDGPWQKLKFGYHVLDMADYFLRSMQPSIDKSAEVASSAVIKGDVQICARAKIMDQAVIQGPAYIGEDAIIGNHALVRQSMIERDSVIGFGSEIVRSYVGAACDLHHAYIGDSVLEGGVHFGFNAHTANLRFDRQPVELKLTSGSLATDKIKLGALIAKGTEIGANATLMPGVTIGSNSLIYAGTMVYEAVADDTLLKSRQEQITRNKDQ